MSLGWATVCMSTQPSDKGSYQPNRISPNERLIGAKTDFEHHFLGGG
jgi:hypothetical protein